MQAIMSCIFILYHSGGRGPGQNVDKLHIIKIQFIRAGQFTISMFLFIR